MLFNQFYFIFLFLPITVFGLLVLRTVLGQSRSLSILWLVIMSFAFYAYWSISYVWVLFASIAFNYVAGTVIHRWRSIWVLSIAICANLGLLGYFKYAGFLAQIIENASGHLPWTATVILPLGISFFTFQQIAYLVDTYRNEAKDHGVLEYVLFIAFFPQLIAGPIVHQSEILPQLRRRWAGGLSSRNFAIGGTIFIIGFFKKAVMGDTFGNYADPIFAAATAGTQLSAQEAWTGMLAFTFQIYFDFSGYSDMAIGLARMFNIRLPENFRSPYKSTSIIEFWRTWHMTLSRFLRDYIYFPLGGNKKGRPRRYANLLIVMIVGGLWHGAGWLFVLWGAVHGLALCINHFWRYVNKQVSPHSTVIKLPHSLSWGLTFAVVSLSWVLFRSETPEAAMIVFTGLVNISPTEITTTVDGLIIGLIAVAFVWVTVLPSSQQFMRPYRPVLTPADDPLHPSSKRIVWSPTPVYAMSVGVLFFVAAFVYGSAHAPMDFIYFEF